MKKFLIVLIVLVSVGLFAAEVTFDPYAEGTVTGEVKLDRNGISTSLDLTDLDLGWTFGIGHDILTLKVDLDEGDVVTVSKMSLSATDLAFTWYKKNAFSGYLDPGVPSLMWFSYLDDGAQGETAVLDFPDLFSLGFQDQKMAAKTSISFIDLAALMTTETVVSTPATDEAMNFKVEKVALEATAEPIKDLVISGGYGMLNVDPMVNEYFASVDYTMLLMDDTLTVNPYAFYSNDELDAGKNAGLNVEYEQGILSSAATISVDAGYKMDFVVDPAFAATHTVNGKLSITHDIFSGWVYGEGVFDDATQTYKLQAYAKASEKFGPLSVTAEVGSGDYATWPTLEPSYGNLIKDFKDLSFAGKLGVTPALGLNVLADPTLSVSGGYYLLKDEYGVSVKLTSKLYDLLSIEAGMPDILTEDGFNLAKWYVKFYYEVAF